MDRLKMLEPALSRTVDPILFITSSWLDHSAVSFDNFEFQLGVPSKPDTVGSVIWASTRLELLPSVVDDPRHEYQI